MAGITAGARDSMTTMTAVRSPRGACSAGEEPPAAARATFVAGERVTATVTPIVT